MLRHSVVVLLALSGVARLFAAEASRLPLETIKLPAGFSITVFAGNVTGARSLTLGKNGTVFVSTRDEGKIYAVVSRNGVKADRVVTIARGLTLPNGIAFRDGALYVAETARVLRYDNIEARLDRSPAPVTVGPILEQNEGHNWRYCAFGPDGKLYIGIGAPCNVCESPSKLMATISRMNADGTGLEVYAAGVRNSMGFDWEPSTQELWFTDNGRDELGENLPPDELNIAPRAGLDFGYPYCYGKNVPDPFGKGRSCADKTPSALDLPAHVAALGMRFYTGTMFPQEYRDQVFIAEHGSWNRSVPIGYRVSLVRTQGNRPAAYQVFAEGWLQREGKAWGRPVDVLVMPDGALLVSDDKAGVVYRISYTK